MDLNGFGLQLGQVLGRLEAQSNRAIFLHELTIERMGEIDERLNTIDKTLAAMPARKPSLSGLERTIVRIATWALPAAVMAGIVTVEQAQGIKGILGVP